MKFVFLLRQRSSSFRAFLLPPPSPSKRAARSLIPPIRTKRNLPCTSSLQFCAVTRPHKTAKLQASTNLRTFVVMCFVCSNKRSFPITAVPRLNANISWRVSQTSPHSAVLSRVLSLLSAQSLSLHHHAFFLVRPRTAFFFTPLESVWRAGQMQCVCARVCPQSACRSSGVFEEKLRR